MTGKSISLCTVLGYSILAVSVGIFVLFGYILLVWIYSTCLDIFYNPGSYIWELPLIVFGGLCIWGLGVMVGD